MTAKKQPANRPHDAAVVELLKADPNLPTSIWPLHWMKPKNLEGKLRYWPPCAM